MKQILRAVVLAVALSTSSALAQGTFQNLDFESVQNIPVFDPQGHPWKMPAADALPGWSCYLGTNQSSMVAFNDLALDSAFVGIVSNTSPYAPIPVGLLDGQYCLSLQHGISGLVGPGPFTYVPASVAQSGQIPFSQSIQFKGTIPFEVTFAGNTIPLVVLSTGAGYDVYGGDIRQYVGMTGELRSTSYSHFSYLDGIEFSMQVVPEPSTFALLGLGALALYMKKAGSR
jgi:hypothetical protein